MSEIIKDTNTGTELIWITDAMHDYRRSREWFQRRVDLKKIRTIPQPGSVRIYLVVEDVKREIDKGED